MQAAAGGRGRGAGGMPSPAQIQAMQVLLVASLVLPAYSQYFQRAIPPDMLRQLRSAGGMAGMQDMMKSMGMGGEGAPSMEDMQSTGLIYTYTIATNMSSIQK